VPIPPTLLAFLSPIISAATAYAMVRINRAYTERKTGEGDEKTWRQGRLDAESAQKKALDVERQDRAMQQLKFEQDLAAVTGILKEFAEAQRLLTGLASETKGLANRVDRVDTRLDQYNESLEAIREHIMKLALNQQKP
jgi:chromosome segregation ATPase